jgi:hypothetical protein
MTAGGGSVTVDTDVHVYGDAATWRLVPGNDRMGTHVVLKLGNRVTVFITSVAAITHLQQVVNEAAQAFTGVPRPTAHNVASSASAKDAA